jgi:Cu/Zn superoxide dismutase
MMMRALLAAFFISQCLAFSFSDFKMELKSLFSSRDENLNDLMLRGDLQHAGSAFLRETAQVGSLIMGVVDFFYSETNNSVFVSTYIYAQNEYLQGGSYYGITVHEYGDVTEREGESIGGHFVGTGSTIHGCPPDPVRHAGDLGNFFCSGGGLIIETKEVSLLGYYKTDPRGSIIGRAVALHGTADQCAGSYVGPYIAIGTVGIAYKADYSVVGLDFEPDRLVARLTGSVYCFQCQGTVWMWKEDGVIRVRARAFVEASYNYSVHGFIINEFGDISAKNGLAAGGHYDRFGSSHALPPFVRHQGDLGNNQYRMPGLYSGGLYIQIWLDLSVNINFFSFQEIAGRAVSFYESADKGKECSNDGGLGDVWAQGVLGIAGPDVVVPNVPAKAFAVETSGDELECAGLSPASVLTLPFGLIVLMLIGLF